MHDSPQAEINKMNNILHNEVEVKNRPQLALAPRSLCFCLFAYHLFIYLLLKTKHISVTGGCTIAQR